MNYDKRYFKVKGGKIIGLEDMIYNLPSDTRKRILNDESIEKDLSAIEAIGVR